MTDQSQSRETSPGSSVDDEPVFLVVGKLRRPHGVRGEMVTTVLTDFPELISPGIRVYVGEAHRALQVHSVRSHQADLLISFESYLDRSEVGFFRNQLIYLREEDFPELPTGEYYFHQVVGLQVETEAGQSLGRVSEVLVTGANDVYIVQREGERDLLLPAIEEVIREIDVAGGKMIVKLLPGLLDL